MNGSLLISLSRLLLPPSQTPDELSVRARGQAHPSPEAIYTLRKYLSRVHTYTNGYNRVYTAFMKLVLQWVLGFPHNFQPSGKFGKAKASVIFWVWYGKRAAILGPGGFFCGVIRISYSHCVTGRGYMRRGGQPGMQVGISIIMSPLWGLEELNKIRDLSIIMSLLRG